MDGFKDDLISLLSFRSCQMHSTAIFKASLEAYVLEAKMFRMSDMKGLKLKLPRPSNVRRERKTQDTTHGLKEVKRFDLNLAIFNNID